MSDDLTRDATIGPEHDPMRDLAARAVVQWVGNEVNVSSDKPIPRHVINAAREALAGMQRTAIGRPVFFAVDGARWVVSLDNVIALSNREAESACECAQCGNVWVPVTRRDPSWVDIIGTPCPCAEGHTMTPTPLGLRLLAQRGLKVGADGKVAPL